MFLLDGSEALPGFRLRQLESRLRQNLGRDIGLTTRAFYLIQGDRLPAGRAGRRLLDLLDARPAPPRSGAGMLVVVPRPGTISPWSSKATDILVRCGFGSLGRIEHGLVFESDDKAVEQWPQAALEILYDRMTQIVVTDISGLGDWFAAPEPEALARTDLSTDPRAALEAANRSLGLALSGEEIKYLADHYRNLGRDPSDAELMMFAQANSEHCRHKIFNAGWTLDGHERVETLFGMIRGTHAAHPAGVLTAYDDNAAVLSGGAGRMLASHIADPAYREVDTDVHIQIKVETHNHPTAISPHPGAATGAGGEIRDESATGRGARPVAGLTGFTVSDLRVPGHVRSWETGPEGPARLATPLQIMLEGPIGAAAFNNEFGRPALGGYFRTFTRQAGSSWYGYHKPIMIAGGCGVIRGDQVRKQSLEPGDAIIVLGGPAMLIGLGGGAASSMAAGTSSEDLDFASVQRGNPEMQRRCQEVIDQCWGAGQDNPVRAIHDVGAGGLSNAIPELLHDGGVGGHLELREIPTADPGLSPVALWCNEAQERYVLAVRPEAVEAFGDLCARERCPWALLGTATDDRHLRLDDRLHGTPPVDLSLDMLLGAAPRMHRQAESLETRPDKATPRVDDFEAALQDVLRVPAVADKSFLVNIGDRTVGGLSVRDPMVGPWQVPVADCAITLRDFSGYAGQAMAMGERTPLAVWDAPASGRMAVGEVVTNLAGVAINDLGDIKLSANWMAAAGAPGQDAALFATVEAVAVELCPALGLAIPVGKDSLSMRTTWPESGAERSVTAPVSLIITGFAPVDDVRRHLTPELSRDHGPTRLLFLDVAGGGMRLGGSALATTRDMDGGAVPDLDDPARVRTFFEFIQAVHRAGLALAYHDRSDGGLVATVLEMGLAGHTGVEIACPGEVTDPAAWLFNEELGAVIQVREADVDQVCAQARQAGFDAGLHDIGRPAEGGRMRVGHGDNCLIDAAMAELEQAWSETSYVMTRLRDHPDCAEEAYTKLGDWARPGLQPRIGFDPAPPAITGVKPPRVAILREQGVNGQREMARAFMQAGFEAVDVHMSDLEAGTELSDFQGLAVCGGFSFGDVLGAGQGWARSILFNDRLRDRFTSFFARPDRFALGVCNGCQVLAALKSIIPGAGDWPGFTHNRSRQFEARLNMVEIADSPSIFLVGMSGSRLPVVTAHGEGRADFGGAAIPGGLVALRYVTGDGHVAETYPDNPNGSPDGVTGLCNSDGRVTVLMPHPERLLRTVNFSWAPRDWNERSPWMKMFDNARNWCKEV